MMDITAYLDQNRVHYQVSSHPPAFTAQKVAAEEHVPGMNVAKPVVVQVDGRYYMCVLPACCKVDLELLRSQLGAGEVELAREQEMEKLFPGCELGAEPPFGNIFGMQTLMDISLHEDDFLIFQGGRHDRAIKISRADYEALVKPRILCFGYHLH